MKIKLIVCAVTILIWNCTGPIDKETSKLFQSRSQPFVVTVYPVHVVVFKDTSEPDFSLQNQVVTYLNETGYAHAVPSDTDISVPVAPHRNQAKMFQFSAKTFTQQIEIQELSTPYALLVETLSGVEESNMGAVHYYIVDRKGHVVAGGLSNSHWEEFTSVNPRSREDGVKVAFNMFDNAFQLKP